MSDAGHHAETRMTDLPEPEPLLSLILTLAAPPERTPRLQWADVNRVLSSEASGAPGEWLTFPFQKEPLDAIALGAS